MKNPIKSIIFLLIIFPILLMNCEKEQNAYIMQQSEKELLYHLKNDSIIKSGKISITITNTYCTGQIIAGAVHTESNVYSGFFGADYFNYRLGQYPNGILFGSKNLDCSYREERLFATRNLSSSSPYGMTILELDRNKGFFVYTDRKNLTFKHTFLGGSTVWDFPIISFIDSIGSTYNKNILQTGDILLLSIYPDTTAIYWIETIIHCDNLPYTSFIKLADTENIKLKKIYYDISDLDYIVTFDTIIPQSLIPINILKSNIFGQSHFETINPSVFITDSTTQNKIIEIPLNIRLKDISIIIPLSYTVKKHVLSFTISY